MENFQYSVQLSDQDWAEFSATTEECGLLQASLASGDELLSSDIDQGDSSGSSPPGPRPLLGGSGWPGFEEEDQAATKQLVSRSWQEPALALGAGQQTPSTSAQSEARPSLSSGAASPGQSAPRQAPSEDEMQRLLQGPAPRDPAPRPPGEPPPSPESPGRSPLPQRPPGSPGAPPRSPSRKKRRAAGAKGGGRSSAAGSAPTSPLGSPLLSAARPDEVRGPAGSRGKGPSAGSAKRTSGAGQDERGLESAGAPEQVAQLGLDLSTPVLTTEQGSDPLSMTPRAGPHAVATPAPEPGPDFSMAKSDPALSTPTSKPHPDTAPSTPASKPHPDTAPSTPASKPHPDTAPCTPASKPHPDTAPCTPASKPHPDKAPCTPASKPHPDTAPSTPASKPHPDKAPCTPASKPHPDKAPCTPTCQPRLDVALPPPGRKVEPQVDPSAPALKAECDVGAPTLAPVPQAGPDAVEAKGAPQAKLDLGSVVSSGGHQEKPRGEPSAGAPGHPSGEPPPGPVPAKKKKVRFSVSEPSPKEPGSEEATRPLSPATGWPSAPRTATGGRGGPGAWDAVAVGPRLTQPRILKHLPPPAASATGGPGYKSCFAVTVPEAYEFFFCDTIEEEDEEAEEAEAGEAQVQWPEVCEFFFRDSRAKRSGPQGGHSPAPAPEDKPVPAALPGDPMPISFPEAYEHFLGADRLEDRLEGVLGPAAPLPLQARAAPTPGPQGVQPGPAPEPSPVATEQLDLVLRQAGEPWGPLTSFTFSQKDMCLVFVAFATWAVRTSDLHTPDAWKTVLLANIGTISAIRYFRRQVRLGRRSPSP
ncbi:PGC-1 and ERR-induced regulator in muscle protein 1 isoform X1 [Myotis myotis]|uniref:PPARGC1 and ESRR induced regulator, muscle 1 n=1 Tax=Myotis myotis TaxID=51298 RepID=A0A7J7QWL9_MYOMY|nr:PGC-1 and ERR-induced regulator in muscle protein 1 isoform X1 [Myotis myotis]KAF6268183.1 PPARGC1 and ESRR induced regulator, muscle 1 [Myotis myotis]